MNSGSIVTPVGASCEKLLYEAELSGGRRAACVVWADTNTTEGGLQCAPPVVEASTTHIHILALLFDSWDWEARGELPPVYVWMCRMLGLPCP